MFWRDEFDVVCETNPKKNIKDVKSMTLWGFHLTEYCTNIPIKISGTSQVYTKIRRPNKRLVVEALTTLSLSVRNCKPTKLAPIWENLYCVNISDALRRGRPY